MKVVGKVACSLILIFLLLSIVLPAQPVQAATGFRISGRNLLDANGNNFIIRGISHPHVWYQNETSSFANIKAAGINTVRVVLGGASDVANVIQLCKTNKLICMLENRRGHRGEIQTRVAKADWSNYAESGDYSFDPTKTTFADWDHVTLYRNGVLVWGIEP